MALRDLYEGYRDPKPFTGRVKKEIPAYLDDIVEAFYEAQEDLTKGGAARVQSAIEDTMKGEFGSIKQLIKTLKYDASRDDIDLTHTFSDDPGEFLHSDPENYGLVRRNTAAITKLVSELQTLQRKFDRTGSKLFPYEPDHEPAQGPVPQTGKTIRDHFRKMLLTRFPTGQFTMRQAKDVYDQAYKAAKGHPRRVPQGGGQSMMNLRDTLRDMGAKFSHNTRQARWQGSSRDEGGWPSMKDFVRVELPPQEESVKLTEVFGEEDDGFEEFMKQMTREE